MPAKVLISWSGERSKSIAEFLRVWLPLVLPGVDPWVSSEDIRKGSRWPTQLGKVLEVTQCGVLVVLPGNKESAWLNFEAGAVSKWVEHSSVAPLLFDMKPSDLTGPLALFQATVFAKDDVLRLLNSIASTVETEVQVLEHDRLWPQLERDVEAILRADDPPTATNLDVDPEKERITLTDEHYGILRAVAASSGNFMTGYELTSLFRFPLAKVQMLADEIRRAGYLSVQAAHMAGNVHSVTHAGTKHLVEQHLME